MERKLTNLTLRFHSSDNFVEFRSKKDLEIESELKQKLTELQLLQTQLQKIVQTISKQSDSHKEIKRVLSIYTTIFNTYQLLPIKQVENEDKDKDKSASLTSTAVLEVIRHRQTISGTSESLPKKEQLSKSVEEAPVQPSIRRNAAARAGGVWTDIPSKIDDLLANQSVADLEINETNSISTQTKIDKLPTQTKPIVQTSSIKTQSTTTRIQSKDISTPTPKTSTDSKNDLNQIASKRRVVTPPSQTIKDPTQTPVIKSTSSLPNIPIPTSKQPTPSPRSLPPTPTAVNTPNKAIKPLDTPPTSSISSTPTPSTTPTRTIAKTVSSSSIQIIKVAPKPSTTITTAPPPVASRSIESRKLTETKSQSPQSSFIENPDFNRPSSHTPKSEVTNNINSINNTSESNKSLSMRPRIKILAGIGGSMSVDSNLIKRSRAETATSVVSSSSISSNSNQDSSTSLGNRHLKRNPFSRLKNSLIDEYIECVLTIDDHDHSLLNQIVVNLNRFAELLKNQQKELTTIQKLIEETASDYQQHHNKLEREKSKTQIDLHTLVTLEKESVLVKKKYHQRTSKASMILNGIGSCEQLECSLSLILNFYRQFENHSIELSKLSEDIKSLSNWSELNENQRIQKQKTVKVIKILTIEEKLANYLPLIELILSPDAIFAQTITIVVEDISSSVQRQDVIESLLQITNCFNQPIQSMSDFNGHFEPLFRDHHLSKMKSFLKSQYETISKSLIARGYVQELIKFSASLAEAELVLDTTF